MALPVLPPLRPAALAACLALAAPSAMAQTVSEASGAVLRALDRQTGELADITIAAGRTETVFGLDVTLESCRFPTGNPAGDAFAFLRISERGDAEPEFEGWMIASSPALSALDHPRYDVWVIRCSSA